MPGASRSATLKQEVCPGDLTGGREQSDRSLNTDFSSHRPVSFTTGQDVSGPGPGHVSQS